MSTGRTVAPPVMPCYAVSMPRDADVLCSARASAGLSLSEMGELVGLNEAGVEMLEKGEEQASTAQLDRYARVFGLGLRHFLAGEAGNAPASVLFRSLNGGGSSFRELLESGAFFVLGEFLRCAADMAELERDVGLPSDRIGEVMGKLSAEGVEDAPIMYRQAERLAVEVRKRLGLGLEPVPSMIDLVENRLGVALFWVGPDELDRDIDGASARASKPAILVNLVEGAECWWRTRMTLAHELCHVLFDLDPRGPALDAFLFSPHRGEGPLGARRRALQLPPHLECIERRANAFAANFLAPPEAVKSALGSMAPTSSEAINVVCQHFQIGRVTAANVTSQKVVARHRHGPVVVTGGDTCTE